MYFYLFYNFFCDFFILLYISMYLLIVFLRDSRKKCLEKSKILKELSKYI